MAPARLLIIITLWIALHPLTARAVDWKPRPAMQKLQDGVLTCDIEVPNRGTHLWLYLPDGAHANHSLACVLVAPAGSNGFTGMTLADADRAEHLPYVKAGFAVISYEIEGALNGTGKPSGAQIKEAFTAFMNAKAGTVDAATAIDYLIARVPEIDPNRIYTAGHSSAATAALLVAAVEPRVVACAAYAPVTNLPDRLGPKVLAALDHLASGGSDFVSWSCPNTHVDDLKQKQIFLFTAADDTTVPTQTVSQFADALKTAGGKVELKSVQTGGHHDSMIKDGIPAGIEWLTKVDEQVRKRAK